jgi:hypothetical protein
VILHTKRESCERLEPDFSSEMHFQEFLGTLAKRLVKKVCKKLLDITKHWVCFYCKGKELSSATFKFLATNEAE